MKISVITVVYNDLEGLKKTTASVAAQTDRHFEYVVIDGGSTDGAAAFLAEGGVADKWISERDRGIYHAMNKGVDLATGEFCIFMNAGDKFHDAEVISKANAALGEADLYVGSTVEVGSGGAQCFAAPSCMTLEHLLKTSIYHQSTFIRRSLLKEHPYEEGLHIVADWAFFFERWLRGAEYRPLDFFVSFYYLGGYSGQHVDEIERERRMVIDRLLPLRLREALRAQRGQRTQRGENESRIERKVRESMEREPVARDLSLIRYGGKFLVKDLLSLQETQSTRRRQRTQRRGEDIRVLYDSQAFDMQTHGGVSRCFAELAAHLPQDVKGRIGVVETDNTYLNNMGFPAVGKTYEDFKMWGPNGVKRFFYKLKYNLGYGQWGQWDRSPKLNLHEGIRVLQRGECDVLHPTFFSPYFLPYLQGIPFVLTVHDMITELYPQYYPADEPQLNNKRVLIPRADHIVAVSENTKRDIMRLFDVPERKITVVYHGADSTPYKPNLGSNRYGEYILYVGERHWYKNFRLLLRELVPVLKRHGELRVVCTGKPFSPEEQVLLDFLGLTDRFVQIYVKTDQELLDLYHHAVCFVYPSEYEGFGIPILEAYKADCPVMLNHASCFPEIAGDAAVYFRMKEGEKSDFEEQFETLYHLDGAEREALLLRQRERLTRYTWEESARKLAEVYRKVVER
ncbi:MAG: glycosyltransferase [Bacteroidaceae bacterium]|nr:glycosyltransferase [Bacteroidaceae bacterium]